MSAGKSKASQGRASDPIKTRKLRACNPSMKVPGDGKVEVPLKRFDSLGGNRSAAHYADAMGGAQGVAKGQNYGRQGKKNG